MTKIYVKSTKDPQIQIKVDAPSYPTTKFEICGNVWRKLTDLLYGVYDISLADTVENHSALAMHLSWAFDNFVEGVLEFETVKLVDTDGDVHCFHIWENI